MKVCIFGYMGNMGRRYASIVRNLGHEWCGVEPDGAFGPFLPRDADALIIATPTDSHAEMLETVKDWGKPVLVEKPVCKDQATLERLIDGLKKAGTRVQMVNQYDFLPRYAAPDADTETGLTVYDYWNSGKDGLLWDCIQLVWHAKGGIYFANESAVWKAAINGGSLRIQDMDLAYIHMVERWLMDPACHYERILEAHARVHYLSEHHELWHES